MISANDAREIAEKSKAWPFEEARKLVKRIGGKTPEKGYVLFETGYGPSGLPHIGTFGEVSRTTMVRHAFHILTEDKIPTKMICFSDDMDGMRKIPGNVPNQDILEAHLGKPLTHVPNPFEGDEPSFAAHNNAKLCAFLDKFGFDYEFASATEYYSSGKFDDILLLAAKNYQKIMDVMLPTLGAERQATYSPFLPISPKTGQVLYVPMKNVNAEEGLITFEDEGEEVTLPVTGGHVKLQWKPDFGMRWAALGVDFEMYGKDHQANSKIYSKICSILGARPPEQYCYELFLDDKGEKISKTKGNGISIDEWLTYASPESLSLFMFQKPRTAKRLYFDVIPKAVDEYLTFADKFEGMEPKDQLNNPAYFIHSGTPPKGTAPVPFAMLLNLVSASNASEPETLWGFVESYAPGVCAKTHPQFDAMIGYAIRYYQDFVLPTKQYREATEKEKQALQSLISRLKDIPDDMSGEDIQSIVYAVGKEAEFENLRDWFKAIYQILLGQDQGPRFGSFISLYGRDKTIKMIQDGIAGAFLKEV